MGINEQLKDPLEQACFECARQHILYGYFLADLNRRYTNERDPIDIPTACVMKYQGSNLIELVANYDFLMKLQPNERVSLLIHEVLHVLLNHIFLTPWFPEKDIAGLAHDMVVNQIIRAEGMTPIPGWIVETTFPNLKLPPNLSSLEYYHLLLPQKQKWQKDGKSDDPKLDQMLEQGDTHGNMWIIGEGMSEAERELDKVIL